MTYLGFSTDFQNETKEKKTNLMTSCEIIIMIENSFPLFIATEFI